MRYLFSTLFSACAIATMGWLSPAIAQSEITMSNDSPSFQNREITANNIKVSVSYDKNEGSANELRYTLYYNNQEQLTVTEDSTFMHGNVSFDDLDNNGTPEVIIQTYSGGAHCCTAYKVYTWQEGEFVLAELGPADGGGGEFKDLNNDGNSEFITFDQNFFYAFSSYAGSFPPSIILAFRNGSFEEVTQQYPQYIRSWAWQKYLRIRDNNYDTNGVLASYVADKILLGEFEEGWNFMLVHYDRDPDMEYNIYNDEGEVIGRHPDFPAALRAFLIDTGYLNRNGQPIRNPRLADNTSLNF
ncbi:MAG: hypothetical protein ACLFV6_08815 [Spirulinaceae cyanobacterium]